MSLLKKLKSLWYPIGTCVQESQRLYNSLRDYFISLYSEQRQFTETLLSLFIRCSVPGVVLIVSILDICILPYLLYSHEYRLTRNTVYCAIPSDQIVVGCPFGVPISYYSMLKYQYLTEVFLNLRRHCNSGPRALQPCCCLLVGVWPLGSLVCGLGVVLDCIIS